MKSLILFTILLSFSACHKAEAKRCNKTPLRVAVIDTGFGFNDLGHDAPLCKYGHKDFTIDRQFTKNYATKIKIPLDLHGHGTNIVGIIDSYAKRENINYCLVIVKFFSTQHTDKQNLNASIRAINYAANIHVNYINYSGGGAQWSLLENNAVKHFLSEGGHFIAAAGNEGKNLEIPSQHYYPAMYDPRIVVVGNMGEDGKISSTSNYGNPVTRWEIGERVTVYGITMSGSSQSTATATGKILAETGEKCDIGL